MSPEEEKIIAKKWYRQGVLDTIKDVNLLGVDNDFETLYGDQFKDEKINESDSDDAPVEK